MIFTHNFPPPLPNGRFLTSFFLVCYFFRLLSSPLSPLKGPSHSPNKWVVVRINFIRLIQPSMLLLTIFLHFLHFTNPIPALPQTHSSFIQSQFKPGQIFAGDLLPPKLQKAPIVQPVGRSFVSSFSGYSFDYTPATTKDPRSSFSSPSSSSPNPDPSNPYDQTPLISSSSQFPSRDAFILRPYPAEQFLPILPPPSLPVKPANELAKFLPPRDSQKPKLTGWVLGIHEHPERLRQPFPGGQSIVDPAAYFMEGADLSRVRPPRCSLIGCKGPVPNDSDFQLEQEMSTEMSDRACQRTFVPLNRCMDGRGYPIGMICSVCCECSPELAMEMRKSRGWIQGYRQP